MGFIKGRAKIWKEHMEKTMNEENERDHMVDTDVLKGPAKRVTGKETVKAMQKMKSGKST